MEELTWSRISRGSEKNEAIFDAVFAALILFEESIRMSVSVMTEDDLGRSRKVTTKWRLDCLARKAGLEDLAKDRCLYGCDVRRCEVRSCCVTSRSQMASASWHASETSPIRFYVVIQEEDMKLERLGRHLRDVANTALVL